MSIRSSLSATSEALQLAKWKAMRWFAARGRERNDVFVEPVPSVGVNLVRGLLGPFLPDPVMLSHIQGPLTFEILRASSRIGLFDTLDKNPGQTLEEITTELGVKRHAAETLLLGLSGMRFVKRIGERYYADPMLSVPFLRNSSDEFFTDLIEYYHHVVGPAMHDLYPSIVQDRPVGLKRMFGEQAESFYEELSRHPEQNVYFERFMRSFTLRHAGSVAAHPVFSQSRRVLDVGGSSGSMALAIVNAHKQANVTVFDFPGVVEETERKFARTEFKDRLGVHPGDVSASEFPTGYDCFLFSNFIDIFSEATNRSLIERAYRALPPGGTICIANAVVGEDEREPFNTLVLAAYFTCLANGEGRFYRAGSLADWIRDAGFSGVEVKRLPGWIAVVTGTKPLAVEATVGTGSGAKQAAPKASRAKARPAAVASVRGDHP